MADTTVVGVSGGTLSIPFSSAANAQAAQSALTAVINLENSGYLTPTAYDGTTNVNAPGLVGMVIDDLGYSNGMNTPVLAGNISTIINVSDYFQSFVDSTAW